MSDFLPKLYCLDYYSFVIYFEIRKCDTSHFVFLSPFCFGSLGSVLVSYKFLDFLFHFYEKYHWNFDRDCTESVDCFGYGHFNNINSNP